MRAFFPVLAVLLLCVLPGKANDANITGVGGTFMPLKGEHKTIQMVREHVRMTIRPDFTYRVTVDFVFRNHGRATSVLMGFPEWGDGDFNPELFKDSSGFNSFATWVDGRRMRARYKAQPGKYPGYKGHWIKRVRFGRQQTRRIRVRFESDCNNDSNGGFGANYDFTGGNWRGIVQESLLSVSFNIPGNHTVRAGISANDSASTAPVSRSHRGNRFFFRCRNWQAEGSFDFYFKPVLQHPLAWNFEKPPPPPDGEVTVMLPQTPGARVWPANQPKFVALHRRMSVMSLRELGEWFDTLIPGQKDRLMPTRHWRSSSDGVSIYQPLRPFHYVHWRERDKTAWLRVGVHVFGFRAGKAQILVNGKVNRLPAAPLMVLDRGQHRLYVPLAPIMKALGGKTKLYPQQKRVWFHL